jgi:hypothetical protein
MSVILPFAPGPSSEPGTRAAPTGDGHVIAMPHIDLRTVQEMMRCFRRLEERGLLPPVAARREPRDQAAGLA